MSVKAHRNPSNFSLIGGETVYDKKKTVSIRVGCNDDPGSCCRWRHERTEGADI